MSLIIGLLNQMKMIFPQEILLSIYNTLVLPHLSYCILSRGKYCEPLTLLQKRAMRAICYTIYNVHTEPLFKMCNVPKLLLLLCATTRYVFKSIKVSVVEIAKRTN